MNNKVLKTLEFNKIIDHLESLAESEKAKEYCRKLTPVTDIDKVRSRQQETSDAFSRIMRFGTVGFSKVCDVKEYEKRLSIGGTLNIHELLTVAGLLKTASNVKSYGRKVRDDEPEDSLSRFFNDLNPCTPLREEIEHALPDEDTVADDASPALKDIRREMGHTNEKIRSQMNGMLTGKTRDYLQEAVITMRNGRYCLPVKSEYKGNVPGMVHDQSSTGITLFIEPMAVVNLNNALKELELKEASEIERILSELSVKVGDEIDSIAQDFYILSELDFIFAKGKLAHAMNAVAPVLNEDGIIRLRAARHPLLDPEKVVPIDLTLGEDFHTLVVTGPNTGGKTVSLKTVGLLTLMGQAGLHIPAGDRSEISVFENVYADIGDEQSIEQSLSTFSSHMTNIVRILQGVSAKEAAGSAHNALVLFDELCSGTDPAEGAALAEAILKRLHALKVRTMATTHYSELKVYALSTPGVENASCEFSLETLSPTYRLLIGVPGKSNAFAISEKLGLPHEIIEAAKVNMDAEDKSFEDLMIELEAKRRSIETDRVTAEDERRKAEALRKELESAEKTLADRREAAIKEANFEAARILKEAKDTADETIRDFNRLRSENPDIREMEEKRAAIGKKMNEARGNAAGNAAEEKAMKSHTRASDVHIGDRVKVLSMNLTGTVHTLPDKKGELTVQMGIMKSKVALSDIILIADDTVTTLNGKAVPGAKASGKKGTPGAYGRTGKGGVAARGFNKALNISPEIKLLGYTADEAISELDKYLDDAYLSHLPSVRVVHGKGTGALRKAVHEFLRKRKYVEDFHLAEFGEGDAGVTIVKFKE